MAILKPTLAKDSQFGSRYVRYRIPASVGAAIGIGATLAFDIDVSGLDNITILASQTATAAGDLGLSAYAFDASGTGIGSGGSGGALHLQPLAPAVTPQAQVLAGGNSLAAVQYDCRGIDVIEIQVKNNNVAAKVVNFVDVLGGVTGAEIL